MGNQVDAGRRIKISSKWNDFKTNQ